MTKAANTTAAGAGPGRRRFAWLASRFALSIFALLGVSATAACVALSYAIAHRNDDQVAAERRAALRASIGEYRALFKPKGEIDPRFVQMLAQGVGLRDLRFEIEPSPGREVQPVLTEAGRILGFFTWEADMPTISVVNRLMPLFAGVAAGLLALSGFSLWRLRRSQHELEETAEMAERASNEDKLTGLPNHAKVLDLLDLALSEREDGQTTTFALLELDGMADVNAQHGVLGCDELLVSIAGRIKEALPADAVLGRIGSEEFAITLTAADSVDVERMLREVMDVIVRPHWIDRVVRVSAHAGFAQAPQHATTRGELTRRADVALRKSIQKGPGTITIYQADIDNSSEDEQFIRRELPRALTAKSLDLHFQPIVAAQGARIVGVEALLRWNHPERGMIPPATFIPVAEQMGLMDQLGAFVLRRALAEARRWPQLYVGVNLSPVQVRDRSIVDFVRQALAEAGVDPKRLMLEITEGVLIENPEEMVKRIEELHALGVRIALDDFGSGYSNLGYLQRFPLDKLKIDKSFVTALGRTSNGGVIINAIVALGRALGVSVLVEGVETEEQRVLLRLAGCDEMQGYLFAKPAPAQAIDKLLKQPKAARASDPEALTA